MFPGIEDMLIDSLTSFVKDNPEWFWGAIFFLCVMILAIIALALVIPVAAIWVPFQLSIRIYTYLFRRNRASTTYEGKR